MPNATTESVGNPRWWESSPIVDTQVTARNWWDSSPVVVQQSGGSITFDFTSPEGKTYSVTGPDGATPEQAFAVLQQHLGGAQPQAPQPVTTNQLVRSAAEGIPIAGGAIKYLNAATNATLAPVVDPLLPDSYDKLNEPTWPVVRTCGAWPITRGTSRLRR